MKWILTKDKLPKEFEDILICVNERLTVVGFMGAPHCFYEYILVDYETERLELNPIGPERATHWMPLPEPPKE